jgi:hypothetical protein
MHLTELAEADAAQEQVQQVQVSSPIGYYWGGYGCCPSPGYHCCPYPPHACTCTGSCGAHVCAQAVHREQPLMASGMDTPLSTRCFSYSHALHLPCVQEFYGDFIALEPHHFTIPVPSNDALIHARGGGMASECVV